MNSLDYHAQYRGKIGTLLKSPVEGKSDLSLAYTPGVAEVSKELAAHPERARELSLKSNTVAVVSDGSAVLGLGNIGAYGAIPVMEGKAALFKKFGNVDAFPICLQTQDPDEIVAIVKNLAPVFGGINLEDIAAPKCFEIERRLIEELDIPVMHDDQHGTAVVVLAALTNALKVVGKTKDIRIVVNGAGAAGTAVVNMLLRYGFSQIVVCDSLGALALARTDLNPEKRELAQKTNPNKESGDVHEVLKGKDVFIGLSKGNLLTAEDVRGMASGAIVFAMANPIPEIFPDEAKRGGAAVAATGRSDFPNQINNVLAFPGIFRGALDAGIRRLTPEMLVAAAERLAGVVEHPTTEMILPDPFNPAVSVAVASAMTSGK